MNPQIITYDRADARQVSMKRRYPYRVRWLPTWGPIGRRRVRRLTRQGWQHAGALQTGLLRRDHCLLKRALGGDPL